MKVKLNQEKKSHQQLSEKYTGKLTSDVATELQDYVSNSRMEWGNRLSSNGNSTAKTSK